MYELRNVSFSYTDTENGSGVKALNLTIKDGEVILLCGESGCGKSTLIRLLNGLIPHYYKGVMTGKVLLDGESIAQKKIYELAGRVGTVFQDPKTQFFSVNAFEEIVFGCENIGLPREETVKRMERVTGEFGIGDIVSKSLFALSGGENQKIACASVAAMAPGIILLDEPSSNLDITAISELKEIIAKWKAQGKTIVAAEHRLYYWLGLADRVIYIKEGKIESDLPAAVFFDKTEEQISALGLRSLSPFRIRGEPAPKLVETAKGIRLSNLSFTYGSERKAALDIPDMEIPQSEIIAVIGPNGAGKSTFARCMCGLEKRMKGCAACNEEPYRRKHLSAHSFMVMQNVGHQLFAESVNEELLISIHESDDVLKQMKADIILEELNLIQKRECHPQALSGGEKQRVAIGCALVSDKQVLFFDEPTSGLDFKHMQIVSDLLKVLRAKGKTCFIITHDPELLFRCATYYIELEAGKIRSQGWIDHNGEYISNYFGRTITDSTVSLIHRIKKI